MRCAICGRGGCQPWERNTDGTYAHAGCLYATSLVIAGKGPKGGNLYSERVQSEAVLGSAEPAATDANSGAEGESSEG